MDSKAHTESYSTTQYTTYHYSTKSIAPGSHDAAWDAFVKMYNDVSTIKESVIQCVPATGVPGSMK